MEYISIHHSAPIRSECFYYKKGKEYTLKEYHKLVRRQQQIKQLIKDIILTVIFGAFVVLRAYTFLEYGI